MQDINASAMTGDRLLPIGAPDFKGIVPIVEGKGCAFLLFQSSMGIKFIVIYKSLQIN